MKRQSSGIKPFKQAPALSPEEREQQIIAAAYDLAEKQIIEGTASPSVITHFLKLGTATAELERIKLERENELLKARTDSIDSMRHMEEAYTNVIEAMKRYSGRVNDNPDEAY